MVNDAAARFVRHRLVAEVGDAGQQALCRSVVRGLEGDEHALRVAVDYMQRSGMRVDEAAEDSASSVTVAVAQAEVQRVASGKTVQVAAAELLGAVAAVEAVKRVLGVGTPMPLSSVPKLHGDR